LTREAFLALGLPFEEHDPTAGDVPIPPTIDLSAGAAGRGSLG